MIQVSDSEDKPDRSSSVYALGLVVVRIDNSSEEEEEEMSLNKKKGLRELLADRAKGSTPKDTLRSQPHLPIPLPPPLTVNPFAPTYLKKRKKEKEKVVAEEGELVPQKEMVPSKQQKMVKGKGKPSRSKVGRTRTWPRCAFKIPYGTLGWSWIGKPFHGTPPSGSSRKDKPNTSPKP